MVDEVVGIFVETVAGCVEDDVVDDVVGTVAYGTCLGEPVVDWVVHGVSMCVLKPFA